MIDVELHAHTRFSADSLNRLSDVIGICRKVGLQRIAITDHNEIEGALRAREMAPDLIIVGEEVMTTQGELLCLFIEERIPPGLTPEAAIARVREQGGLVGASHPFDYPQRAGLGPDNVIRLRNQLDFLETYNARTRDPRANERANALALALGLPRIVGSDAHTLAEIGRCRVRMPDFNTPQAFLAGLHQAELITRTSSWMVHVGSRLADIAHRLGLDREGA
ncbi:MAG: PHP-associated domain-containing protein [Anaerolineae bacterium]|nr:PHP domain-containing protein [Thermoflexales bacterium]MDW8408784.1 PHP-associated domain-containing protein [Anaerolineae bacterium]